MHQATGDTAYPLSPEMAVKEIWVYVLAYNLIRLMMAQAAHSARCLPRELSFKHTVQLRTAWAHLRFASQTDAMLDTLFVLIVQPRVGKRPGRIEPRGVKRRPKPYPLLTKPRALARKNVRLHGHPKKVK